MEKGLGLAFPSPSPSRSVLGSEQSMHCHSWKRLCQRGLVSDCEFMSDAINVDNDSCHRKRYRTRLEADAHSLRS